MTGPGRGPGIAASPSQDEDADPSAAWIPVVAEHELVPGRGVGALVGSSCVAVFLLPDGSVHAVGGIDPVAGANVMARGLVGEVDVEGRPVRFVASPIDKRRYRLDDGRPLDSVAGERPGERVLGLGSWPARVEAGTVEVASPGRRHRLA